MIAFIIGAQRSGTTVVARCLNLHDQIAHFYEPYYIWDYYVGFQDSDVRTPSDLNPKIKRFIRKNYNTFINHAAKPIIIDKLPDNCFRIPFLNAVFPYAKWIHLLRDGRDVTLSMHKEWKRREKTVVARDYKHHLFVIKRVFGLQPFWRFRILQILYELKTGLKLNPNFYLTKTKWAGRPGWGPRFPGWQEAHSKYELIQFNALQWLESVNYAQKSLSAISKDNILEVRYENFIQNPNKELKDIINFLGCRTFDAYFSSLPIIDKKNYYKWKDELSKEYIKKIGPLLSSKLIELGYEKDNTWYLNS